MRKFLALTGLAIVLFTGSAFVGTGYSQAAPITAITQVVEDGGSVGDGYRCVFHASTGEWLIQFFVPGYGWLWTVRRC